MSRHAKLGFGAPQFSDDLKAAMHVAHGLALSRRREIAMEEFLAGLYVGCFERLLRYWTDWRHLTAFMAENCGLSRPAWTYWTGVCDDPAQEISDSFIRCSADVNRILNDAKEISLAAPLGGEKAVLRLEHVLSSVARNRQFRLCEGLVASGLDLAQIGKKGKKGTA